MALAENALDQRLKALIGFRAAFVTLLLGSLFLFRVEHFNILNPRFISYYIIFLYLLTIVYALSLNNVRNLFLFAYVQLLIDVLSEICLIYFTGGMQSWFSFTLILTVLSSSIVINRKAGYLIASISIILYGLLLGLQFKNMLPYLYETDALKQEFIYKILIHAIALYVTAFLSGYLSSSLEKTVEKLEEKDSHLKDLERFNTKVIESLPSGLFTTDPEGYVQIFNRAAEKITGISRDQVIGRKIEIALPFVTFPFCLGRHEGVIKKGEDSKEIIGLTISSLEDINRNTTGFIGIFQDLTQMKRLEAEMKQKEKWAVIGEISASMAHEIRNPLASLKGSIEMLKEGKMSEKYKNRLMDIALDEMERLDHIITDFLTYSRPKPLEVQRSDINYILDETLDLLRHTRKDKNKISIIKGYKGELYADVDPSKIRQVFWNLGINAFDAIEDSGTLTVSTEYNINNIKITFTDSGTGINPDNIDKIFYPFFTTKDKGTGLGLAIAYRIIEEHNGTINVSSSSGMKTSFEIILPVNQEK